MEKILIRFCSLLVTGLLIAGCATPSGPAFTSEPEKPAAVSSEPDKPSASASELANRPVTAPEGDSVGGNLAASQKDQGVRLQVGDMVIVTFSGNSDQIPPHEERIKEDGNITLPLIGAVKALGKSDGDLQTEIHSLYVPKYYVRLTVTVRYNTLELSYSVLGEVRGPGPKPYSGKTTVTKAIGAAGGLTEFANKTQLVLTRANGARVKINYKKAIKDPKLDPQVFPGDSINVVKSLW